MLDQLKTAINAVELVVAFIAVLLLGDLLGHKVGRWRLASLAGIVTLIVVLAFVIYAAISLSQPK